MGERKAKSSVSRRDFIKNTTAGAAAASAATGLLTAKNYAAAAGANQRLRVGFLGVGGRCQAHVNAVMKLMENGVSIEPAAVCDVFNRYRNQTAERIKARCGKEVYKTGDYRDIINDKDIDIVVVATPDHWHAKMTIEALKAGKAVYCEKPMTKHIEEAFDVVRAWRETGQVMQVGVQSTSEPRWHKANEFIRSGGIGKVIQAQNHYYRNSRMGQWRYYALSKDMTPKNIDWDMFLGHKWGLAPKMPFDRAKFAQWRCYWPFGSGLFTDLFVHRLTQMLVAIGVRYPRRVTGGGGIFLEYDGRDVPDTATIIADYDEGLQIVVTATMCNNHAIERCIRGFYGTLSFDTADGFDFLPERPQVVPRPYRKKAHHVTTPQPKDPTYAHWENFVAAVQKGDPKACNNPPDLGAAALVTIVLGAKSYREGKVFELRRSTGAGEDQLQIVQSDENYAKGWEAMSHKRLPPRHVPGWNPPYDDPMFSRQIPPSYQKLEGPWPDENTDPAQAG